MLIERMLFHIAREDMNQWMMQWTIIKEFVGQKWNKIEGIIGRSITRSQLN